MKTIGILSDTHGSLSPKIVGFFQNCDEIWHAGDIGDWAVMHVFENKTIRAVYGNIDGTKVRNRCPERLIFNCEGLKILMTHIGTQYGRYTKSVYHWIKKEQPNVLVCGHSHILKIQYDKDNGFLFVNPGAAGSHGFHKSQTAVRTIINKGNIEHMEVIDVPRKN